MPDWTGPLEVEPAEVLHHVPPYLHAQERMAATPLATAAGVVHQAKIAHLAAAANSRTAIAFERAGRAQGLTRNDQPGAADSPLTRD